MAVLTDAEMAVLTDAEMAVLTDAVMAVMKGVVMVLKLDEMMGLQMAMLRVDLRGLARAFDLGVKMDVAMVFERVLKKAPVMVYQLDT